MSTTSYNVLDEGFFQLVYQNSELGTQAYGGYLQMVEEQKGYMLEAFLVGKQTDGDEVREFIAYYQSQLQLVMSRLEKLQAQGVGDEELSQQSERLFTATLKQCFELYPGYQELMQSDELAKATTAVEKAVAQTVLEDAMAALTPELKAQVETYLQTKNKELDVLAAELMGDLQQLEAQNQSALEQPVTEQVQPAQQQPATQEIPVAMPVAQSVATPAPAPAPVSTQVASIPAALIQTEPTQAEPMPVPQPIPAPASAPAPIPTAPVPDASVPTGAVPVAPIPVAPAPTAQAKAPVSNQLPPLPVEVPAAQQQPAMATATRELYRPVNVYPAV